MYDKPSCYCCSTTEFVTVQSWSHLVYPVCPTCHRDVTLELEKFPEIHNFLVVSAETAFWDRQRPPTKEGMDHAASQVVETSKMFYKARKIAAHKISEVVKMIRKAKEAYQD